MDWEITGKWHCLAPFGTLSDRGKSEIRSAKSEGNPNSENRIPTNPNCTAEAPRAQRGELQIANFKLQIANWILAEGMGGL
jgi:hypothetical protein